MVAGGLGTDWPHGRGCYVSSDESITIWIGYEDHIRVTVGSDREKELDVLLDRLHEALTLS